MFHLTWWLNYSVFCIHTIQRTPSALQNLSFNSLADETLLGKRDLLLTGQIIPQRGRNIGTECLFYANLLQPGSFQKYSKESPHICMVTSWERLHRGSWRRKGKWQMFAMIWHKHYFLQICIWYHKCTKRQSLRCEFTTHILSFLYHSSGRISIDSCIRLFLRIPCGILVPLICRVCTCVCAHPHTCVHMYLWNRGMERVRNVSVSIFIWSVRNIYF